MKTLRALTLIVALAALLSPAAFAEAAKGQGVDRNFGASCHDSGIAGAPKAGDKAAWSERISKGLEAMTQNAIRGFKGSSGFMPAKGGNSALTDEEVTSAVMYMHEMSK